MMKKDRETKKILSLLLETYSIEEIKDIFKRIDNRIIDLMEFSSKDFIEINKVLKHSYNDIKSLETISNDIFNPKISELTQKALSDLERTNQDLKSIDKTYRSIIIGLTNLKQSIAHVEPLLIICIKNLKQNIVSLKLWVTNNIMELEKIDSAIKEWYNKQLTDVLQVLEVTLRNYHCMEQHLQSIIDQLTIDWNYNFERAVVTPICEPPQDTINNVKEWLEENNQAVSNIVTKLQYHDIVRQKVEHIQQIHNEIIQELDLIKDQPENDDIHKSVKYFYQIRDISGLQAAQLFHVNNDYQKAIKTITTSLLTISDNIDKISTGCKEYARVSENCPKELSKIYQFYYKVVEKWQQLDFSTAFGVFTESSESLSKMNQMFTNISQFNSNLELFADDRLSPETLKELKDILVSIETNINDCLGFAPGYENFLNILNNLSDTAQRFNNERNAIILNKPLANQLHVYASELTTKINELRSNARGLSKTLNEVVDNIAYYEYFDQVIEQVIDELNTINISLLEEDVSNDPVYKRKNLEFIKQKYTMQSEYDVHENTLNKTISDDNTEENEDDNDVEFF